MLLEVDGPRVAALQLTEGDQPAACESGMGVPRVEIDGGVGIGYQIADARATRRDVEVSLVETA